MLRTIVITCYYVRRYEEEIEDYLFYDLLRNTFIRVPEQPLLADYTVALQIARMLSGEVIEHIIELNKR